VDARADLFALGVLWAELLTGRPLREPARVAESKSVPEEALPILRELLAQEPRNRPGAADQVLASLEKIGAGLSVGPPGPV
jgi:hypothetical protein